VAAVTVSVLVEANCPVKDAKAAITTVLAATLFAAPVRIAPGRILPTTDWPLALGTVSKPREVTTVEATYPGMLTMKVPIPVVPAVVAAMERGFAAFPRPTVCVVLTV